jgi:hypothetical protein
MPEPEAGVLKNAKKKNSACEFSALPSSINRIHHSFNNEPNTIFAINTTQLTKTRSMTTKRAATSD